MPGFQIADSRCIKPLQPKLHAKYRFSLFMYPRVLKRKRSVTSVVEVVRGGGGVDSNRSRIVYPTTPSLASLSTANRSALVCL